MIYCLQGHLIKIKIKKKFQISPLQINNFMTSLYNTNNNKTIVIIISNETSEVNS